MGMGESRVWGCVNITKVCMSVLESLVRWPRSRVAQAVM